MCADRGGHRQCEHRAAEQIDRQHRCGQRVLAKHEEPADADADSKFDQHGDCSLAAADAVERGDEQAEGDRVQHRAQRIERMAGQRCSRQEAARQPQGDNSRGHLQREQPGPGQHRHDRRRHRRAGSGRSGDHQRVEADAAAERFAWVDEAHQRAVDAHDAGAAEALQHAAEHQHRQRRRERADQRCRGIDHKSPDIDAAMAVDVAHRGERQQRDRDRELIRVHHPDRFGGCDPHVVRDRGQCDVGDRSDQDRHGDGDGDREHRSPPLGRRQPVGHLGVVHADRTHRGVCA